MKKRIIAIAFSDLHLNIWSKFNEGHSRTFIGISILDKIAGISHNLRVPALFCGDLLHKPENIDQDLALYIKDQLKVIYNKYPRCKILAIEGNHDFKHTSTIDNMARGWVSFFEGNNLEVLRLGFPRCIDSALDIQVYGVSYIDHNIGLCEYLKNLKLMGNKSILLLHTDYPGAKDTDGREIDSVENLNINTLNKFDLVLCGHIHKPQRLSKKVYMLGATNQQRRTDKDCKLGYWNIYNDLSMEFVPIDNVPKFIDVESEEDIKDDGNYYTVIPKNTRVSVNEEHKITKQLSKKSLARQYMKEKGIKDKNKKNLLINILNKAESC